MYLNGHFTWKNMIYGHFSAHSKSFCMNNSWCAFGQNMCIVRNLRYLTQHYGGYWQGSSLTKDAYHQNKNIPGTAHDAGFSMSLCRCWTCCWTWTQTSTWLASGTSTSCRSAVISWPWAQHVTTLSSTPRCTARCASTWKATSVPPTGGQW